MSKTYTSRIGAWLCRLLCWCAAFPYAAYPQLTTPGSQVAVVVRGIAVIVSPLAFTLALASNGVRFVGHTPYLYLLPVVVFSIDWLLIARSYTLTGGAGSLALIRILVLAISGFMGLFAGLLSESENLLRRLHNAEDAITMQRAEAQNLDARLKAINDQIARNETDLLSRNALEAERVKALRLREMECRGRSGVDTETGMFIVGGGICGVNAETYRIDAEAAGARLAKLNHLDEENTKLAEQSRQLDGELNALLQANRSPADSVGSLTRALKEADAALWGKLVGLFLFIMVIEAFSLILSEIPVPQPLRDAVRISDELDGIRLQAFRDASVAELTKQRTAQRAHSGDALAPLEVTLTTVNRPVPPTSEPGTRRQEQQSQAASALA